MKFALAQIALSCDLPANLVKHEEFIRRAAGKRAEFVVFPELSLTGYCPKEFSFIKQAGVEAAWRKLSDLSSELDIAVAFGSTREDGGKVYNSCVVQRPGKRPVFYDKNHLTEDEAAYFAPGTRRTVIRFGGVRAGFIICRDQNDPMLTRGYARAGADVVFQLCAQYYAPSEAEWKKAKNAAFPLVRALENGVHFAKVNAVGRLGGSVSHGGTLLASPQGRTVMSLNDASEGLLIFELEGGT